MGHQTCSYKCRSSEEDEQWDDKRVLGYPANSELQYLVNMTAEESMGCCCKEEDVTVEVQNEVEREEEHEVDEEVEEKAGFER